MGLVTGKILENAGVVDQVMLTNVKLKHIPRHLDLLISGGESNWVLFYTWSEPGYRLYDWGEQNVDSQTYPLDAIGITKFEHDIGIKID